ncbi:hypothetical protein [Paracoccus sp. AS002]|uniref:hypothetical protein n=1 Tax=Paracoccus sp. AS002 TaxID=3019545 RepID=UPI0023E7713F|nr:hypothetical protein [Paracoccus sp. AS002]MDF3904650.1 hypothetical protein [Paracoccus sp. AS002]
MAEWYTRQSKANLAAHIVKQEADLAAARAEIEELKRQLWNMTENAKALAENGSMLIANLQEGEFVSATREQEWLEALRALKGDGE